MWKHSYITLIHITMLWHISLVSPLLVVSFEVKIHRKVSDLDSPSFLGAKADRRFGRTDMVFKQC
ncbi:unnamed protein product [Musa acuminata var. zebrina]